MKSLLAPLNQCVVRYKVQLLFAGVLFVYFFSPNYVHTNQYSRFGLTQAIVERGTFCIDEYINGVDWSRRGEHYYTNKAPGSSFLGVPFYFFLYYGQLAIGADPVRFREFNLDVTDWFITAVPSVLLSLFLLKYLLLSYPTEQDRAWMSAFVFSLGTIVYPFSTALWGHATAAAFLFFAFYAMIVRRNAWVTGIFLSLAVLTEYSAVLAIPFFLIYHVLHNRRSSLKGLLQIFFGAVPVLGIFLWYHKICFGGLLTMPTVFQNPHFGYEGNGKVFNVLAIPDPIVAWKLLFGLERGLLLISPVLIFSVLGFRSLLHEKRSSPEVMIALPIVIVFWIFNSCYVGWRAGWSSGPRYLIPMLPFLMLGLARCAKGRIFYCLLCVGLLNCVAIASVTTMTKPGVALLTERIYPALLEGNLFYQSFLPLLGCVLILLAVARATAAPQQSVE